MSTEARRYATEHNLCPSGAGDGTIGTQGIVYGNCGAAWMFVSDDVIGDAPADFAYGTASILGTIVYTDLRINWTVVIGRWGATTLLTPPSPGGATAASATSLPNLSNPSRAAIGRLIIR